MQIVEKQNARNDLAIVADELPHQWKRLINLAYEAGYTVGIEGKRIRIIRYSAHATPRALSHLVICQNGTVFDAAVQSADAKALSVAEAKKLLKLN